MNGHSISTYSALALFLGFMNLSIGAHKTPNISDIIKKARTNSSYLHSAHLETFCAYLNTHWHEKNTDPITKNINTFLTEKDIVNRIIHLCTHHALTDIATHYIIQNYPAIVEQLIPAVVQSIDTVPVNTVLILMNCKSDTIKTFTTEAIKSIATISPTIVSTIIILEASYTYALLKAAFDNAATPFSTINALLQTAGSIGISIPAKYTMQALKIRVKNFFAKKQVSITATILIMIVFYKNMFGSLPQPLPELSQTQKHVIANAQLFYYSKNFEACTSQQRFVNMIDQITLKEKELTSQGYASFVHAQRWHYRIIEQWYTKLWETQFKKSALDYLFIHCKKPCTDETQLKKEKELRSYILKTGREESTREKLLFLNYAFFGNEKNNGSCSAHYFLDNSNVHPIHLYLEDVFEILGYKSYYQKYQDELEDLEDEHDTLSAYGQVLMIAVPKIILSDCVYFAKQGGYKNNTFISGLGYTDDILTIVDTLRTQPEIVTDSNYIEFCLVLTDDMLTPDTGIKVYAYNVADPDIVAQFDKKSDALFERIKKDIEHSEHTNTH